MNDKPEARANARLTPDTALELAEGMALALYRASVGPAPDGYYARERAAALSWIRSTPFFLGASLQGGSEGALRVFWVTREQGAHWFTDFGLVGAWTPIGRIALSIKNDIKDDDVQERYEVRRPRWAGDTCVAWSPAGSVVDVKLTRGAQHAKVEEAIAWSPGSIQPARMTPEDGAVAVRRAGTPPTADASLQGGFGLHDVLASLDTNQLGNITFPEDGLLVVTGCAGTGKTTVALYRACYLLREQEELLVREPEAAVHFRRERTLLLVRKEHLKPYLRHVAKEMGATGSVSRPSTSGSRRRSSGPTIGAVDPMSLTRRSFTHSGKAGQQHFKSSMLRGSSRRSGL